MHELRPRIPSGLFYAASDEGESGPRERVAAFVAATRPYHARLFRIARSLAPREADAADLTQEALARAFVAYDGFRDGAPILPWLARILRNVFLDGLKTGAARHEVLCDESPDSGARAADAWQADGSEAGQPLAALERAELAQILGAALEALDAPQRLIVILCDVEGFSYEEAAEAAGIPVGTVRSRLSRARAELRRRLRRKLEPEGGLGRTGR
jgi:RNA polymerase sigma-70 factor (ECF subfamily)